MENVVKTYTPKVCVKCSKEFEPNGGAQKKCPECATKQAANTISQRASRKRAKQKKQVDGLITPSTKYVTHFSGRRIGHGAHESSSSPAGV
jgi:hypothetical protein